MLESIPLEERLRQCEKELKTCRENLYTCQERLEACQKERDLLLRINQDHARMSAGWTGSTLLSEILLGSDQEHDLEQEPLSIQLEAIQRASEADQDMLVIAWQFAPPLGGAESLQSYVQRQTQFDENNPGPTLEGSLVFASKQFLRDQNLCNLQEAGNRVAQWFRGIAILRQEWQAHLKNVRCGDYKPFTFRTVVFGGMNGSSSSVTRAFYNIPAVIVDSRGQRYWGIVRQSLPSSLNYQLHWSMRDLMSLNTTRACMITVSEDTGVPLWQNSASMAMIGVHGIYNRQIFSDAPCDSSERQRSINLHIN
ncbi:hypothetical protein CEUSTIGMA_g7000.t1 [Chlamydomonas eustigma]|uniref:Uncharacterized protein n=1 Tax=Chlamydomonas eustigma TaxID=1157962 RepID=A0A250X9J5_9CHLO|nr:hypothetical protein CEUSTIGMA_g7000.t1 [Chlamydomonas eustigma]|eukprot:GAX79559.1 hypothetical protein CEUSTIGMA_g7000.t1 [Chlamydomonas eustigma]